jgi:UDP-N-acetylmuramyl pentapeptide phosphotransferase/UDP-N-acetylglucosamine-1-phosphate transferase
MMISLGDRSATWLSVDAEPRCSTVSQADHQEVGGRHVARGDHPMRTPVYGGLMIVAAMVGATLVWQHIGVVWLRDALLVVALGMALAGWIMTFRDLSNPRPRRR